MPDTPPLEPQLLDPPPDQQAYRPFPRLASALRAQSQPILKNWRAHMLISMPELGEFSVKAFENDIAAILSAMADALESNDAPDLQVLMAAAPAHGFHRFLQKYELVDLFTEERTLRRVIVAQVEEELGAQCKPDEAAALHSLIDLMLQQGVLALVQQQKQELRWASETQLKYLSFLSHDLANNFLVITTSLVFVEQQISKLPEMRESAEVLSAALSTMHRTQMGMRGLLQHGRLRQSNGGPRSSPVRLRDVVEPIVKLATPDTQTKGMRIEIDIAPEVSVQSSADLLTIILQNLIGNAIKHASIAGGSGAQGVVRIAAARGSGPDKGFWTISVADDGPGIPSHERERLFLAFQRLPDQDEKSPGDDSSFGLGLAIASEAARLLDTTITVESELGQGSTFSFRAPAVAPSKR